MKSIRRIGVCAMLIATVASLSACDTMTTQQRNAAIGAGIGGVAGAAIGGNDPLPFHTAFHTGAV